MSGVDSDLEKQPISPVNGQTEDINGHSPAKGVPADDQTPSIEGIKATVETGTVLASAQSDSGETREDGDDRIKESIGEERAINGVEQSVGEQKNSQASETLGECCVKETKHSETCKDLVDGKQVDGQGVDLEIGKEDKSFVEHKESEPNPQIADIETNGEQDDSSNESKEPGASLEAVTMETNGEQGDSSAESREPEASLEAVTMETDARKGESSAKSKDVEQDKSSAENKESECGTVAVDLDTNVEQGEASADNKKSEESLEHVTVQTKAEQVDMPVGSTESELVASEINGEQVEVEKELSKVETTCTEPGGGKENKLPDVMSEQAQNGEEVQSNPSQESKVAETEPETVEKCSASTNSQEQKDASKESRTVWYTGVDVEDTPSNPDSNATPEETVSYTTSIVGGVVHRVPINSSSPKGQHKPRQESPQTPPKKRGVLSLFGRRKKSKGAPESPAGASTDAKEVKKEDQKELHESASGDENVEKQALNKPAESSPVAAVTSADETEKETTEPSLTEANPEVEDTNGVVEKKEAAVVDEGGTKPSVAEQGDEGIKDETRNVSEEPKEAEIRPQEVTEDSVPVESSSGENGDERAEGPKGDELKEAVKRSSTGSPEEDVASEPAAKKHKSVGLLGGFFTRRKSKKSANPPVEKAGDETGEPQHVDSSAQSSGGATGMEQGAASDAPAKEGGEDLSTPQEIATEDVIQPAVDQTVESGKADVVDSDKVDAAIVKEKAEVTETEKMQIESRVPEDVQKSPEEILLSKETVERAEKSTEETAEPFPAEDSQPKSHQGEGHVTLPNIEVNHTADEGETAEDKAKIDELKLDYTAKQTGEQTSPEPKEAQDEAAELTEQITLRNGGSVSYSPARHMQMRISYAERDGEGGKEVEVIGTPEKAPEATHQKGKADHRVSCRGLGEADYEGWLSKKGGMLFLTGWKRKWVVLKDGKLYFFKTAFDPEASGVINMKGATVTEAPETKKQFCFKCAEPGSKPQVSVLMAQSKEDLDKWLAVLAAASRGEIIRKSKQQQEHLSVKGELTMRRRSGSSAQRHSSVLAVGGRQDFLEDKEDRKLTRRRSNPAPAGNVVEETQEKGKETGESSDAQHTTVGQQPSTDDQPSAPSDAPSEPTSNEQKVPGDAPLSLGAAKPVPSDAPSALSDEKSAPSDKVCDPSDALKKPSNEGDNAPPEASVTSPGSTDKPSALNDEPLAPARDEDTAPNDSHPVSEPSDQASEETPEGGESKASENTVTVVVNKVLVGGEKIIVESTSSTLISSSDSPTPADNSSADNAAPAASLDDGKANEENPMVFEEATAKTEKQDSSTDAESPADKTDGDVSVTTTESVVEIARTSLEISESVERSTLVSAVESVTQESPETEVQETESEVTSSESNAPPESEPPETSPSEDSPFPPESPSKTRWYFSLDRKETWSVTPEPEEEMIAKRPKSSAWAPRKSTSSDRGSINSTSSEVESIKSLPDDDELMKMCRSIRKARLSIVGEQMWDGAERMRAFSNANESHATLMRLKTLERTLKDKEQHLADLDDLLNQPEINRRSIYEWKLRNSDLLEELFPRDNGEAQEEGENTAEGGEGDEQKQENLDTTVVEKGAEKENAEQEGEKSEDVKEEACSSKEEGDIYADEKQSILREERNVDEEQASIKNGEDCSGKEEASKNEGSLAEEGAREEEQHQSSPPMETETKDVKSESDKDSLADASGGHESAEENAEQQQSDRDALDTRL